MSQNTPVENNSKPIPAIVATDIVLFSLSPKKGLIFLAITINHKGYYENKIGLPGGLINKDETAEESVIRNLIQKSGFSSKPYLEQLITMSALERDPRSRVVSVAYLGLINQNILEKEILNKDTYWEEVKNNKKLAFDHKDILEIAIQRLKSKIQYSTIIKFLLPKEFTLSELQNAYETILESKIDKRNFRKKILSQNILEDTKKKLSGFKYRPAATYIFKSKNIQNINMF